MTARVFSSFMMPWLGYTWPMACRHILYDDGDGTIYVVLGRDANVKILKPKSNSTKPTSFNG